MDRIQDDRLEDRTSARPAHPDVDAFRAAVRDEHPDEWSAGPVTGAGSVAGIPSREGTDRTMSSSASTSSSSYTPRVGTTTDEPSRSRMGMGTTTTDRDRYVSDRMTEAPMGRRRFSLGATFLGWAVAAFFTIVFSAALFAILGGAAAAESALDLSNLATGGLIGYLIASFLAYLIGGYAAGRISLWNGVWHGLGTVAWAVVFAVLGVVAGLYVAGVADIVRSTGFDTSSLTTAAGLLALGLSLLAMLAGAALGGRLGERYHEARVHRTTARGTGRLRGRPL